MKLFLHFHGPGTILLQSRGAALRDVLTTRDVDELADSPAGSVPKALGAQSAAEPGVATPTTAPPTSPTTLSYASVNREGSVKFDEVKQ